MVDLKKKENHTLFGTKDRTLFGEDREKILLWIFLFQHIVSCSLTPPLKITIFSESFNLIPLAWNKTDRLVKT